MNFHSSYLPPKNCPDPAWWFVFQEGKLLVHIAGSAARIPQFQNSDSLRERLTRNGGTSCC